MYGFQGPIHQMPPYQGYPFPPMHPHYAGNMQWLPNMKEANYDRNQNLSSGRKDAFHNGKGSEYSGEEGETESSDSDSGSDSNSNIQQDKKHSSIENPTKKKHRKKSSNTVVIRNINYITPKRRNGGSDESSSEEDEFIDEDSLKKKVDDAVGLLKKSKKANHKKRDANRSIHVANGSNDASDQDFDDNSVSDSSKKGKGNDNWDAFQNLLMRDEEETVNRVETSRHMDVQDEHLIIRSSEGAISSTTCHAVDLESEKAPKQHQIATDSFVVTNREGGNEGRVMLKDFENGENCRPVLKRGDYTDADLLFSGRSEESGPGLRDIVSACAAQSSTIKTAKGEDWFIVNHTAKLENQKAINEQALFDGDCILGGNQFTPEKHRKDILIDDSIMVQDRPAADDVYDSPWRTDISMVVDLTSATSPGDGAANGSQDKHEVYEPDDLCMVLERESRVQSGSDSWSMGYAVDISLEEASKRCSGAEDEKLPSNSGDNIVKKNEVTAKKDQGKEERSKVPRGSIGKSKPEMISRTRKPSLVSRPTVQKSKLEKVVISI